MGGMGDGSSFIVMFEKYCHRCKHRDIPDHEEPCYGCLTISCMTNTRQPINFEGADHDKRET